MDGEAANHTRDSGILTSETPGLEARRESFRAYQCRRESEEVSGLRQKICQHERGSPIYLSTCAWKNTFARYML